MIANALFVSSGVVFEFKAETEFGLYCRHQIRHLAEKLNATLTQH